MVKLKLKTVRLYFEPAEEGVTLEELNNNLGAFTQPLCDELIEQLDTDYDSDDFPYATCLVLYPTPENIRKVISYIIHYGEIP